MTVTRLQETLLAGELSDVVVAMMGAAVVFPGLGLYTIFAGKSGSTSLPNSTM